VKRIYTGANRVDAFLLRDRLQHADIDAHVFNEHMESVSGEVPFGAAGPQVWVDDENVERANQVLVAFAAERQRVGSLRCVDCGEDNPATFELCWNCGRSL
jgi:cytochrome c556